jgi:hypothetical protein
MIWNLTVINFRKIFMNNMRGNMLNLATGERWNIWKRGDIGIYRVRSVMAAF